jgi:nitrous oxidase accessory protein NosD
MSLLASSLIQESTVSAIVSPFFGSFDTANPSAIIVPDDYPTLQSAVGNASAGATIFVKKGIYNLESRLIINKPLTLIGETNLETILDGYRGKFDLMNRDTIEIDAANVTISGFKITNCQVAIGANYAASGLKILNNYIVNNNAAIFLDKNIYGMIISNNEISLNGLGIGENLLNSIISNNTINKNGVALSLVNSRDIMVFDNKITNNSLGILLESVSNVSINRNDIIGNTNDYQSTGSGGFGVQFRINCNNCRVYENNLNDNIFGIYLVNSELGILSSYGFKNEVFLNNFLNNIQSAFVEKELSYLTDGSAGNGTTAVSWDNGTIGNYWSDYKTKYPNATEVGVSGIGDMKFMIDENNIDNYPLMYEVGIRIETSSQPSTVLTTTYLVCIISVIIVISIPLFLIKKKKYS